MNWLLLRGLGRQKRHWLDFPDKLQSAGAHLDLLDLPGIGEESSTRPPLTIQAHTDFLRPRYLKTRKGHPPYGILGMSLGGMIALDWVHRYPDDFKKIVLINTSTHDLAPIQQRLSPFALYCMAKTFLAKNMKQKEYEILKMVSNLKAKDPKLLQEMIKIASHTKLTHLNISRQLIASAKFKSPDSISIPLLVLASIKDRMVDVRCSKAIAEKYSEQAQIKFHASAGHDLTLDDPDWTAEQIREFAST